MAVPRPKQFVAAVNFSHRGHHYRTGDPVTDRRTIAFAVRRGDRYIVARRAKPAPAEPTADPPVVPATNPPAESIKED